MNVRVSRSSGAKRLNVPVRRRAPGARAPAARPVVERAGAAGEQQQQVVARVGVERGEDLVDVDVRLWCSRPERAPVRDRAGPLGAGIERQVHVLQRRARAQQHGRVAVDRRVLLEDVHRHDGVPVLELRRRRSDRPGRRRSSTDWPWPGRDRGALGEHGPDLVVAVAERERRLVLEDVRGDRERASDEHEDRDEVPAVGLDRAPHGPCPRGRAVQVGRGVLEARSSAA